MELIFSALLVVLFLLLLWVPAWWMVGRLDKRIVHSAVRLPASIGLALVLYLTSINLLGKALQDSVLAVQFYVVANIAASLFLILKNRKELHFKNFRKTATAWLGVLFLAAVLALPQLFQAVSGNRWDEMASSAIHITAPNQFSEGTFPPRHNAFPDIVIKYHYGFVLLSGTVRMIAGLSSNVSIDVASTGLWLFTFLMAFFWLRLFGTKRIASAWGSFAVLLGGGLSWLYLKDLRVYEGFKKLPSDDLLEHAHNPEWSWWDNAVAVYQNQNIHLANDKGEIFSLPFDIAVHYQQHAVATGIALSVFAAFMFWLWQTRRPFSPHLLLLNCLCFGLVFLGHSVLGAISAITAGLTLGVLWLIQPNRIRFIQGVLFTLGVTTMAFVHGGMLATGSEYGPPGAPLAIRDGIGYLGGSVFDLVNWGVAGFGFLLLLSLLSIWVWISHYRKIPFANHFMIYFGLFAAVSFLVPQLVYFSHAGGVEEQTEISKFFFGTHLGLALFSVAGFDYLSRKINPVVLLPVFLVTGVTPVISSVAGGLDEKGNWIGLYESPYGWTGGRQLKAAGEAIARLKQGNRDQYYDFSTREASSGYLNELLVYGGSLFSLTPTRYEVTGFGFLISESAVAERIHQESRVSRLIPGAAEESGTDWLYIITENNLAKRPVSVRSRFRKMVEEGLLVNAYSDGQRELFKVQKNTSDLDQDLHIYWSPKVIHQAANDLDGDGQLDLVFYDYRQQVFRIGSEVIPLPGVASKSNEVHQVYMVKLPGDERADLLVGQLSDAIYFRGEELSQMVRMYPYNWHRLDSRANGWQSHQNFSWMLPFQIPVIADPDNDGVETLLSFKPDKGIWRTYSNRELAGSSLPASMSPLPVIGEFDEERGTDLAVWSPLGGIFRLEKSDGEELSIPWGGKDGDILVPGDYDGDGFDELAIWQPHSRTWWVRDLRLGINNSYVFGTPTGIPLPADYNADGIVDLAYWEPSEHLIHVSLDFGESVAMSIEVPLDSIPAFVNMY